MDERVPTDGAWRIEFTKQDLGPDASALAEDLHRAGVPVNTPAYKPPQEATLGTPEILVTILLTATARALVIAGLHALQKALEKQIDGKADRRAQVILVRHDNNKRRFPMSLKNITKEALKEFIDQIVSEVNRV
jgi:hypothetical protein